MLTGPKNLFESVKVQIIASSDEQVLTVLTKKEISNKIYEKEIYVFK